jgi:hypothetical protein
MTKGSAVVAAPRAAAPRYRTRMTYDALHRPIARFLQTDDARDGDDDLIDTVREWSIYGERATDAAADKPLGTAWRALDAAAMVESNGNVLQGCLTPRHPAQTPLKTPAPTLPPPCKRI